MVEKLNALKRKIDTIKTTIIRSAPQKEKDRDIILLSSMALGIIADIEKELQEAGGGV